MRPLFASYCAWIALPVRRVLSFISLRLRVISWVTAVAVVLLASQPAAAVAPAGQDHFWGVSFSSTAAGSNPSVTAKLMMCTDGTGIFGVTHECLPAPPAPPLFDELTISYTGLRVASPPIASRIATLTIDVENNVGQIESVGDLAGQPSRCGTILHSALPTIDIWAAAVTGPPVSMDPSGVPGFTLDQLDDPAQADPTPGGTQGDGWPIGISHVPAVVPAIMTELGIPESAVISRGYGVINGLAHTTVTTLTVLTRGTQGTDPITTIVVFGNPFGAHDPGQADTLNCAPASLTLLMRGVTSFSAGSKTLNGGNHSGDYSPPALSNVPVLTLCDATLPVGGTCNPGTRSVSVQLSTEGDDDGDGVTDAPDNCPLAPDPAQRRSRASAMRVAGRLA